MNDEIIAAREEAKLWADWILSDPVVAKYKEKYCIPGELSADDAASLISILAHIVDDMTEVLREARLLDAGGR